MYINTRFFSKITTFFSKMTTFSPNRIAHFSTGHTAVGGSPMPCACPGVTGCLHQQYGTNSRGVFSVGGRAPARIFGPARM